MSDSYDVIIVGAGIKDIGVKKSIPTFRRVPVLSKY